MQSDQAKSQSDNALLASAQSTLKRLSGSPLARKLLIIFSILPIIEGVFLGLLCYDVREMDEIAREEFNAARTCQEISNSMDALYTAFNNIRRYKKSLKAAQSTGTELDAGSNIDSLRQQNEAYLQSCKQTIADLKKLGLANEEIDTLDKANQNIYERAAATINATAGDASEKFHLYHQQMFDTYPKFAKMLESARKMSERGSKRGPLFGIAPITILYFAALANAIYLILLIAFVKNSISRPITTLARSCKALQSGIPIDPPANSKNETDSLHKSFYLMSLQIAEDKKRRSNYLEILQAVQTTALLKVQDWLGKIPAAGSLNDQSARRLDKARGGISNLIKILKSMTGALNNDGSQRMSLQNRLCSVEKLCQDAATAVEALLETRGIKLNIKAADREISADPVLLGRVLMNLLSNAIKYSPDGGEIDLKVDESSEDITFSVQDRGPGIPAEEIKKLFHKFSQLEALDGVKRSGTGLGLAICREIVEAHAGEIGCMSEPGKGSTFWFKIPVNSPQRGAVPQASKHSAGSLLKRTDSLNFQLGSTMLAFITLQIVLFAQMHSLFQQSSKSAAAFSVERRITLNMQELCANLLQGGTAAESLNLEISAKSLIESSDRLDSLFRILPKHSRLRADLTTIRRHTRYLQKVTNYCLNHRDRLLTVIASFGGKARESLDEMKEIGRRVLVLQRESLQSSYEGQTGLNAKVLGLLGLAATADLLIITAAAIVSLRIIERLSIIKLKADDFAAGKSISPTLSGSDELATLDKQLCEASGSIQEAEQQKQELMAVINHDLRAPLSSILSNLEILSQGVYGQMEDAISQVLQHSEQELHHLLSQINDLLLLEKIDSGTYELAQSNFDFAGVVTESIKQLKQSMEEKDLRLTVEAQAELDRLLVNGDRALLVRVCTILLSNAIAASPSHGTITMAVDSSDGKLVAEIENTGQGVDPELKNQIFDRFRFIGNKPLTGMGLPLAQRLCRIHGGSIELKPDHANDGAAFLFRLPLAS